MVCMTYCLKKVTFMYLPKSHLFLGILNKHLDWSQDSKKFQAWKDGRTGVPFVDANMRELKETGWMSNRGRQNVASFLIKGHFFSDDKSFSNSTKR